MAVFRVAVVRVAEIIQAVRFSRHEQGRRVSRGTAGEDHAHQNAE